MTHGDPKNPKKNPHPVKRYEVIATAHAPGPWDAVSGTVFFDVVNLACTPEDKFLGVHAKPRDVAMDFEMARVDEKTWKGHFYRDAMLDEDYYGLPRVCADSMMRARQPDLPLRIWHDGPLLIDGVAEHRVLAA
ncbi:MAG: hypothetical protein ABI386_03710 [Rhodanobacter sp.]